MNKMYRYIRFNFIFALFASIVVAVMIVTDPSTYQQPRGLRGAVGAIIYIVSQVALWFSSYKNDEGKGAATFVGIFALVFIIPLLLIPQVTDGSINTTGILIFLYFGFSNLAYAFAVYRLNKYTWWTDR